MTDQEQEGQDSAEYIRNYFKEKHVFPLIEIYQNQEQFFAWTLKTVPTVVLLALSGVSGLNVAEHLRSLYPKCGIIWCSDLDFSLHAFRLRIEYFFMKPVEEQKIKEGLSVWLECKKVR
nr:response regulator [Mediterraneibacter sp. 210702-DFI.5.30]